MNKDVFQGQWRQMKGEILKAWGELTSDEIDKFKGNIAELAGELQKKYGYAKEEVEARLRDIAARFKDLDDLDDESEIERGDDVDGTPMSHTQPNRSGYDI